MVNQRKLIIYFLNLFLLIGLLIMRIIPTYAEDVIDCKYKKDEDKMIIHLKGCQPICVARAECTGVNGAFWNVEVPLICKSVSGQCPVNANQCAEDDSDFNIYPSNNNSRFEYDSNVRTRSSSKGVQ